METLTLAITLDPQTMQIGVKGPIDDKTLCYGMLESAKDAIRDHCAKAASGIVAASPAQAAAINTTNTIR